MKKLMTPEEAKHWIEKGYVMQFDTNSQKLLLVHQSKAAGSGVQSQGLFTPPSSIKKRTPVQRVDSLMLKLVDDMKKHGGIAPLQSGVAARVSTGNGTSRAATTAEKEAAAKRLADEKAALDHRIAEIVGAAFIAGRTEITGDLVRKVAANLLTVAEKEHEVKVSHQITRHED